MLEFATKPAHSCAQVNELLDGHIAFVKRRIRSLRALEKQLVALRKSCDGDTSHVRAILDVFTKTADGHA